MIKVNHKYDCNGCTACMNICPVDCIRMETDDEGFLFAKADEETCIECEQCEEVCPLLNKWKAFTPLITLAASNKNKETCFNCTSGGIFSLLSDKVLKSGGVVFGAAFDDNWQVKIDYAESSEDALRFRTSKYVQARPENSYQQVEKFLHQGRQVLFSGTPCQIAGLKHFLYRDYPNLLTVEVACHGVPSPLLWQKYMDEISSRHLNGKKFDSINFRYKYDTWRGYRLVFAVGEKKYSLPRSQDPYLRAFVDGLSVREACYNCKCKMGSNHADITLADFWGSEHIAPDMENSEGLSLVVAWTEKGISALPLNDINWKEVDLDRAMKYNEGFHAHTKRHPKRDVFFQKVLSSQSVSDEINRLMQPTFFQKVRMQFVRIRDLATRVYHKLRGK